MDHGSLNENAHKVPIPTISYTLSLTTKFKNSVHLPHYTRFEISPL